MRAERGLAHIEIQLGNCAAAERIDTDILRVLEGHPQIRELAPGAKQGVQGDLGYCYLQDYKYPQAENLLRRSYQEALHELGPENEITMNSAGDLAQTLQQEGKYRESEDLVRTAIELRRRVQGPDHLDTLQDIAVLAQDYRLEYKLAQAESIMRQVVDLSRKVLGPEHLQTLYSMAQLGLILAQEGKFAEDENLLQQALDRGARTMGASHPVVIELRYELIDLYKRTGQVRKMQETAEQALRLTPNDPGALNEIAWDYATIQPESARRAREALELARRSVKLAPDDPLALNTLGLAEVRSRMWRTRFGRWRDAYLFATTITSTTFSSSRRLPGTSRHGPRREELRTRHEDDPRRPYGHIKDPETLMLWREAASALGKRIPASAGS